MHHRIVLVQNTGIFVQFIALKDIKRKTYRGEFTLVKEMENGVEKILIVFPKIVVYLSIRYMS